MKIEKSILSYSMLLTTCLICSLSSYADDRPRAGDGMWGRGSCSYLTKPMEQKVDGEVVGLNTWPNGSELCHDGIFKRCVNGYWQSLGTSMCKSKWHIEHDAYMQEGTKNPNDDENDHNGNSQSTQNDDDSLFDSNSGRGSTTVIDRTKSCFDKCDESYMQKQFSKDRATCMKSKDPDRCIKETLANSRKYCEKKCK